MIDRMVIALSRAHPNMIPDELWEGLPKSIKRRRKKVKVMPNSAIRLSTKTIPKYGSRKDNEDCFPEAEFQPTIRTIVLETAREFDVSPIDIISHRRAKEIIPPRQVAMYLALKMTTRSTVYIGKKMDGRDHATIIHGGRRARQLMSGDHELAAKVGRIIRRLSDLCAEDARAAA